MLRAAGVPTEMCMSESQSVSSIDVRHIMQMSAEGRRIADVYKRHGILDEAWKWKKEYCGRQRSRQLAIHQCGFLDFANRCTSA